MLETAIDALVFTAIEKICVLGLEGARSDLKQLYDVAMDLISFWDLGNSSDLEERIKAGIPCEVWE